MVLRRRPVSARDIRLRWPAVEWESSLATLFDISADYNVNPHASIGLYYGHAAGGLVVQSIYPNGKNANFGYLELTFRM